MKNRFEEDTDWMWRTCAHCGMSHPGVCPRIKTIEYGADGRIKRVEYHEPAPLFGHKGLNP
jgi:hypothetical protein